MSGKKKRKSASGAKSAVPSGNMTVSPKEAEEKILKELKSSVKKTLNIRQIQSRIKIGISIPELEGLLDKLTKEKKIEHTGGYKYKIRIKPEAYEGIYQLTREGYAVVWIDELGEEIAIIEAGSEKAMNGDLVKVKTEGKAKGRNINLGRVIEIVKRKRTRFIGTLDTETYNQPVFYPQDNKLKLEFSVAPNTLMGAKNGDKVVLELIRWVTERPAGKIVEIIGKGGEHIAEMNAIMMEFGLNNRFSEEIEQYADRLPKTIPPEEIQKRNDFRSVLTFTIDPYDAKDFDDAISFRVVEPGRYEIGVHIADVTYYLKENSILDTEAYERATSVYLVDRTIPMLPEVLSNNLCSLVPNKDRLTYAAVFELDEEGNVLNEWFGRTIIHSDRRFTYEEVQDILDAGSGEYAEELLTLNKIAHALRKTRFAEGSISFETEEVKFRLDEKGAPMAVFVKERKDSHKLIEDFMLLANRKVAEFIAVGKKIYSYVPFVYRIHPTPDFDKMRKLNKFVSYFGYQLDLKSERFISRSLNEMVTKVQEDKGEMQKIIQTAAIRSMPKAVYTTDNVGHYGLGFEYYTHFTSPIRRYPDVMVHRILDQVLNQDPALLKPDRNLIEKKCRHCSDREKNAADAERASIRYKQVEYMSKFIDHIFNGTISGLTDWGMYVETDDIPCEGMIPLKEMKDDRYNLDDTGFRLIGERTRKVFMLGQKVKIQVKRTHLIKRQIDFILVEESPASGGKKHRKSGIKENSTEENDFFD